MIERSVAPQHHPTLRSSVATAGWAAVLGIVSGLACVVVRLFFRLLQAALVRHSGLLPLAAGQLGALQRVIVPVAGAALATVVLIGVRRWSNGLPFEEYVVAIRFGAGRIPFATVLWRTVSSAFSVASGAAIGREGSMIQFATAVTSWVGLRSGFKQASLSRQVTFGVAAAVAAVYQAPVAAVFFAYEIVLDEWPWTELPGLILASAGGWFVSRHLLIGGPLFPVRGALPWTGLVWTLPLALAAGALGPAYQKLLRGSSALKRLPAPLLWSGLVVGLLSLRQTAVWGNGDVALATTLTGSPMLLAILSLLAFRLLATTACVGTGTVGGVFTPTLFAGAGLGLFVARATHVPGPLLLTIVGLAVFLAAVTHAPWMASFMAVELTGQWHLLLLLLPLSMIAVAVARRFSSESLYGIASPVLAPPSNAS